ncbi:MAG TPA: Gfo/Idh/MocA family oxidoreductase [Caulobacteraceae bacterium]|jgi:predicted dehydrogenase|nr:Gfo/Idh/MocA family oxidoreductase [Caulobacteraceae bacterium]
MLKIGLLGASKIAPTAVIGPAAKSDAFTITAVAARDPARARAYAEAHGIGGVADDYAALVRRDDVDIIYNGLPPAGHAEWTIAALEAGKTVLCEKPFARNAEAAAAMVAAAERTGQILLEAFHYRHHVVMRRALEIVASGVLGRISGAEAHFNVAIPNTPGELRWSAEQGGGGLMDLGCYPLHALRTLIGAEPKVLGASGVFVGGVDAEISADLRFARDIEAKVSCSMTTPQPSAALTLTGTRGTLTIVNFLAPQGGCRFTVTIDGVTTAEPTEGPTSYEAQLENLRAVLLDGETPVTGGADAIGNMTAIDAIYRAAGRA